MSGETVLQAGAHRPDPLRAVLEGIPDLRGVIVRLREAVGQDLHVPRRGELPESREMPVPAGVALLLLGSEGELRQLLLPVDPAADLDSPHAGPGRGVPELTEPDLHLGRPSERVDGG